VTVIGGGTGTLTVKVPGTFVTLNPADPTFSGRRLALAALFFGSPSSGDSITALQVVDTDGKVPIGQRGLFPNYPILQSLIDSGVAGGNQQVFIPTTKPVELVASGSRSSIASELYISIVFQKAVASADTAYANFVWDDGT
jgi:hypothetical protein